MKLERLHISVFLGFAALVWWFVLVAQGTQISSAYLRPFGTVVGFLVVLGTVFEFLLWRWSWLHGWYVKRPDPARHLAGRAAIGLDRPCDECRRADHHLLHGRCTDTVHSSDAPNDSRIRILVHRGTHHPIAKRSGVPGGRRLLQRAENTFAGKAQRNTSGWTCFWRRTARPTVRTPSRASTGLTERRKAK